MGMVWRGVLSLVMVAGALSLALHLTLTVPPQLYVEATAILAMILYVPSALVGIGIFSLLNRSLPCFPGETYCRRCERPLKDLVSPQCPFCGERL